MSELRPYMTSGSIRQPEQVRELIQNSHQCCIKIKGHEKTYFRKGWIELLWEKWIQRHGQCGNLKALVTDGLGGVSVSDAITSEKGFHFIGASLTTKSTHSTVPISWHQTNRSSFYDGWLFHRAALFGLPVGPITTASGWGSYVSTCLLGEVRWGEVPQPLLLVGQLGNLTGLGEVRYISTCLSGQPLPIKDAVSWFCCVIEIWIYDAAFWKRKLLSRNNLAHNNIHLIWRRDFKNPYQYKW